MRRSRRSCLALALALAVVGSGCGGPDPGDAVRDYYRAIAERDGEAACQQLSEELRVDIERAPAARGAGRTCADVMRLAAGLNPSLKPEDVDDLEVEVDEDGDRAVATLDSPLVGSEETIDLRKEDGDWRIATLETRPRP